MLETAPENGQAQRPQKVSELGRTRTQQGKAKQTTQRRENLPIGMGSRKRWPKETGDGKMRFSKLTDKKPTDNKHFTRVGSWNRGPIPAKFLPAGNLSRPETHPE